MAKGAPSDPPQFPCRPHLWPSASPTTRPTEFPMAACRPWARGGPQGAGEHRSEPCIPASQERAPPVAGLARWVAVLGTALPYPQRLDLWPG